MSAPTTPISPDVPLSYLHQVVTGYIPEHDGEIRLIVGEIIASVKDLGNGWTLGKNISSSNAVGIFPSTCIRPWTSFQVSSPSSHPLINGHAIRDLPDEGQEYGEDDCHGVVTRMLPREGSQDQRMMTMTMDRHELRREGRHSRSSCPRHNYQDTCTNRYGDPLPGGSVLHSVWSPTSDEDLPPLKAHCASRRCSALNNSANQPSAADDILDCRFLSNDHHATGWCRKKPRMIVKPNLDKGTNQDPQQLYELEQDSDNAFHADYTCKPNETMVTLPKCRTTVPPCDLHLRGTTSTPQRSCLYGNIGNDDKQMDMYDTVAQESDPKNQYELTADESSRPMNSGDVFDGDYVKKYYRDYRAREISQQHEDGCCESQCKPYDSSSFHLQTDRSARCHKQCEADCKNPSYSSPASETDNLFYRFVISILVSQLSGFVLFLWMYYHLDYDFYVAFVVAVVAAMLLAFFLVLSRVCRCTAAVLLPSVCTIRGRVAFVVIISGFLLTGPVSNVYVNMGEISRSMSCSAEQSYNQTNFLLRPFDAMMRQLNLTIARLQEAAHNVSRGLRPLDEGLANVEIDLYNGKLQLLGTRKV